MRSYGTWKRLLLISLRRFSGISCARAQPIRLLPTQYKPQPSPAVPAYLRTYNPTQIQPVVHGFLRTTCIRTASPQEQAHTSKHKYIRSYPTHMLPPPLFSHFRKKSEFRLSAGSLPALPAAAGKQKSETLNSDFQTFRLSACRTFAASCRSPGGPG